MISLLSFKSEKSTNVEIFLIIKNRSSWGADVFWSQACSRPITILQDVQIQAIPDMDSEVWSYVSADIVSRDLCF